MMPYLSFTKLLDFADLPRGWQALRVSADWSGEPLLLIQEGKPHRPLRSSPTEAWIEWWKVSPKAHHLLYWVDSRQSTLTFEQSTGIVAKHVQRFRDGWLLGDSRGGHATIYDDRGAARAFMDLGDASEDLQTTAGGHIWVSYFDEGIYGRGIGNAGVVCFDENGEPMFKYAEFAETHKLPSIDDCYAMNVANDDEVWLSYYSAFPLVCIRSFELGRAWMRFGCLAEAFALSNGTVISSQCYTRVHNEPSQLLRCTLGDEPQREKLQALDEFGNAIGSPFTVAARAESLYLQTDGALYRMRSSE
jgi:hypothetical protein